MERDPAITQQLAAPLNDLFFQLKSGNTIDQQAADPVITVIDMYLIAAMPQHFRSGKTGRASTNDANRFRALMSRCRWLDPAFGKGRFGDMFFDRANGHRFKTLFDHATAFAQAVLRADAATNLGKIVGLRCQFIGFPHPPLGCHHQPVGDVVMQRTIHLTKWHTALRAARGLRFSSFSVELVIYFVKISDPVIGWTLSRHGFFGRHELQHL